MPPAGRSSLTVRRRNGLLTPVVPRRPLLQRAAPELQRAPARYLLVSCLKMILTKLNYAEIHERLKDRPSLDLLDLLDARSTKVGDTAAALLSSRDERAVVLNAILTDKLKTRNGKVRALNFLAQRGRKLPEALEGYLHLIHDLHPDVVDCALFGIAFWNDPRNIDVIRTIRIPRARCSVERAVAALQAGDPSIYSPYFFDQAGVWSIRTGDQQLTSG